MPTIAPPKAAYINTVFGISMQDGLSAFAGAMSSIPYDFFVKATGKSDGRFDTLSKLPLIEDTYYAANIAVRALLLNCLTSQYASLWNKEWNDNFVDICWAKNDSRLSPLRFSSLSSIWEHDTPLRMDYERRQALVEIDVLTAMALGMTIDLLKTIYRIQFPVLQSYEADTWYDANGRIVFTNNRSLTGVGFSRPEFENPNVVTPIRHSDAPWDGIMKHAPAGYVFARTITDDTMPGGPVERTIEYHAPFDRCDREQDYETAWKFFEEKYGKER